MSRSEFSTNASTNSVDKYGDISSHSYDVSVQDTLKDFDRIKAEGGQITGDQMLAAFNNLADSGQITREEFMDLKEWVEKNVDNLSPDAKAAWSAFDGEIQNGNGVQNWENRGEIIISGASLRAALDVATTAAGPTAPGNDGLDNSAKTSTESGGVQTPGSPNSAKAGGASDLNFEGMSWDAIFAKIMSMIDEKEQKLKAQAETVSKKIDAANDAAETNGGGAAGTPQGAGGSGGSSQAASGGTASREPTGIESLNTELSIIMGDLKKIEQLVNMVTNLQKTNHDTSMAVIRNMA